MWYLEPGTKFEENLKNIAHGPLHTAHSDKFGNKGVLIIFKTSNRIPLRPKLLRKANVAKLIASKLID